LVPEEAAEEEVMVPGAVGIEAMMVMVVGVLVVVLLPVEAVTEKAVEADVPVQNPIQLRALLRAADLEAEFEVQAVATIQGVQNLLPREKE